MKENFSVKVPRINPNDDELLELYAYFKQSILGDAKDADAPSFINFKAKAKWSRS